ncbi:MAG: hypothetical protein JW723_08435 [Bacteroidales bacterium]|nr:hypothetical protein [Bacteroidales bacterium]
MNIITSHLYGQNGISKNTFYYEFYGTGCGPFSINYDRFFTLAERVKFAPGIGLSLTKNIHVGGTKKINDNQIFIPVQGNFLFGRTAHHFEFGYGMPIALCQFSSCQAIMHYSPKR